MTTIRSLRALAGVSQTELARAAGTSQPTISAYETGRKSPTLDTVRRLATSVGLEVNIDFQPPMTREERRSLALHRDIARRLLEDPDAILARARLSLATMLERHRGDPQLLREWLLVLDRSPLELAPMLVATSPWAREMRHVTPFAGVLSGAERAAVYGAFREEELAHAS